MCISENSYLTLKPLQDCSRCIFCYWFWPAFGSRRWICWAHRRFENVRELALLFSYVTNIFEKFIVFSVYRYRYLLPARPISNRNPIFRPVSQYLDRFQTQTFEWSPLNHFTPSLSRLYPHQISLWSIPYRTCTCPRNDMSFWIAW